MSIGSTKTYFQPLEQTAFISMEHAAYLKGFLKPFKGKGALEEWASRCEQLRRQLISLGKHHVLNQVQGYPFALLPVQLAQQTTGAGTTFLRWRTTDRSAMGVHLWDELMCSAATPLHLIDDLYAMELQRIILNMQISLIHTIERRTIESIEKVSHAETIYQKRMK